MMFVDILMLLEEYEVVWIFVLLCFCNFTIWCLTSSFQCRIRLYVCIVSTLCFSRACRMWRSLRKCENLSFKWIRISIMWRSDWWNYITYFFHICNNYNWHITPFHNGALVHLWLINIHPIELKTGKHCGITKNVKQNLKKELKNYSNTIWSLSSKNLSNWIKIEISHIYQSINMFRISSKICLRAFEFFLVYFTIFDFQVFNNFYHKEFILSSHL